LDPPEHGEQQQECRAKHDAGAVSPATLKIRATPTTRLMPSEVSQILGDGSKCAATVSQYQIK
jgi:hypothetical protein